MKKTRISAVSYLNTYPFVYGILHSDQVHLFDLHLDVPSVCAERMKSGEADIALVPAGALPGIGGYSLIDGFCIGAVKEVETVLLLSQVPLNRIKKIYLDFDSRTSVELVRILARRYWKINPEYEKLKPGAAASIDPSEAIVAIGDKTFTMRPKYLFAYDLAAEWIRMTNLPFVFAVWISRVSLPGEIQIPFRKALEYSVAHIPESLEFFREKLPAGVDCRAYLEENISYTLDAEKRRGLNLFLACLTESA